ncbi:MAG: GNAT family N-acetyltransferase [Chloroflexota bacterium]
MSGLADIAFRRAVPGDLPACEEIWRDGLNDYLLPLGEMEIPPDNATLRQLHAHVLATDPELFWVATRPDELGDETLVAFAAAARRGRVWFLSMLFVRPGLQRAGLGRALLERILPVDDAILAVATDAAQPISNGLYASHRMVARMPMFNLVGRPRRRAALPPLPIGLASRRFDNSAPAERDHGLLAELAAVDREVLGFDHPADHDLLRRQGRIGFTYRDDTGRLAGYGYTSEVGRIGPVAVRDAAHLAPVVADLLDAVLPRGASAIWVPGQAAPAVEMLIRAGLRIEGFPVLLGWSRPFADFERYTPMSPGLL